jgi:pimeloyl-ACP methyl ester carboxylesterase
LPFAANGEVRIWFDRTGDPAHPAVLLLNGAGKQATDAPEAFCDMLVTRGFQVIRFDQRDTGLSTNFSSAGSRAAEIADALAAGEQVALPYEAADLAKDALAVLDAAGVAAAHLFGRSLGAYVAQLVALAGPERVLSLTLVMAFSRAIGGSTPRERLANLDAERLTDASRFVERQVASARMVGNPAYFDEARIREEAERAFDRGVHQGAIGRHFSVGLTAPDLRAGLPALSLPVQIVHGRLDKIIPLALAEETAAAIPGARLTVLDDMAHEGPPQLWQRWLELFADNAARAST